MPHRYVGDVTAPDVVWFRDFESPQQIRINPVFLGRNCRSRFWRKPLKPHVFHESLNTLAIYVNPLAFEITYHLPLAFTWMAHVLLVDHTHDLQVFLGLWNWFVVEIRSVQTEQPTLLTNAKLRVLPIDPLAFLRDRSRPLFF